MRKETLEFLSTLLDQVTVQAAHPEFEQTVATIAQARRDLNEALAAASEAPS